MNPNNLTIKTQEVIGNAQMLAARNQNQQVDTLHILKSMLDTDDNVVPFLLKKQSCNPATLKQAVEREINRLPKSSGNEIYLGGTTQTAMQKAAMFCDSSGDEYMALEHLLYGIFMAGGQAAQMLKDAGVTEKGLKAAIAELHNGKKVSGENQEETYNALNKYAKNLNEMAKKGKLDPVIGRDEEIRRVLQILSRRTKNNPILIGEAGVGKTAIAEGLAQRLVSGDIPENLKTKKLFSLDMGALIAGAKYKGEFVLPATHLNTGT